MSSYYYFRGEIHDLKANSLTKMLCINTQELKLLRLNNGGLRFLDWIRYENTSGKIIPDNVIEWFCNEEIRAQDILFIRDKMRITMENTDGKIISKIQKLLALGEKNSNENEAQAAILKAHELMAEFGIASISTEEQDISYSSEHCEHKGAPRSTGAG